MGVLLFDGVDDRLRWTTLAQALKDVSDGAWTLAALVKRQTPISTYDGICYLLSGTGNGTTEAGVSFRDDNTLLADIAGVNGCFTSTPLTSTASPYLLVVSKGSGTVQPRVGWKLGSGGSWSHETFPVSVPDQIDATILEIGAWETGDPFEGYIGLVAWWEGAMSDANKEALDDNWRTSDWWNSVHGQPKFLAELNVAGASVIDLAGNASDLAVTGTTLDGGETLDSWNFDGTGAVERRPLQLVVNAMRAPYDHRAIYN